MHNQQAAYNQPPPSAPPSYEQAVGGVPPVSPYTPQQSSLRGTKIVTTVVPVGDQQTHMVCPSCHEEIDSTTRSEPGKVAYLMGFLLCIMGCFCGCCLIPCCLEDCRDVHHTCPNCGTYLGKYTRDFRRYRVPGGPVYVQHTYYNN